jgi:hydrogenase expression/formation protein HypC
MCIGAPAVVLDVNYEKVTASVDYGDGVSRTVIIGILDQELKRGDLVIVHAGVIVSKITVEDLLEQLEFFKETLGENAPLTEIYEKLLEKHRKIAKETTLHSS